MPSSGPDNPQPRSIHRLIMTGSTILSPIAFLSKKKVHVKVEKEIKVEVECIVKKKKAKTTAAKRRPKKSAKPKKSNKWAFEPDDAPFTRDDDGFLYKVGQSVLCQWSPSDPTLYFAEILGRNIVKDFPQYRIHYKGWNRRWDQWVEEPLVMRLTEKNVALNELLAHPVVRKIADKKQMMGKKGKKIILNPRILDSWD